MAELSGLMRLQKEHIRCAAGVLCRSFMTDPYLDSLVSDLEEKTATLRFIFLIILRHGIRHGEAYAVSPDMKGVAIWLPSAVPRLTLGKIAYGLALALRFRVSWCFLRQRRADDRYAARLRKRYFPTPHCYLALIGVAPEFQGQGYASQLLRPILNRLDKENLPCCLDTDSEQNVSMYEHFGFRVIHEEQLPSNRGKFWLMLREIK